MMKLLTTFVAAAACIPLNTNAQTQRDLDSHEHGAAFFNVALDGNELFIELESPWNNLVGFEHEPQTDEQHELIDAAVMLLENPDQLLTLNGGECVLSDSSLESGIALEASHDDEHGDEDEHHDDEHGDEDEHHDDEHSDKDEHDDAEHHDDEHSDEGSHAELIATYVFTCSSPSTLESINADFLQQWTGFETLTTQLIGPGGQSLQELSPNNTALDLTEIQ